MGRGDCAYAMAKGCDQCDSSSQDNLGMKYISEKHGLGKYERRRGLIFMLYNWGKKKKTEYLNLP